MSIDLYDEAVTNKIQQWILDPNLRLLKPDESTRFFQMKLDLKDDKPLGLPLIAISRDKNIDILETTKQAKTYDGFSLQKLVNPESNIVFDKSILINVIPIKLNYQIDIYTRFMKEAAEYLRNFVFNLINYPRIDIEIPYNNINFLHRSNISLEPNLSDNSDIKEHLIADQFTRFTIRFSIDDAYLFSSPIVYNPKLTGVELDVLDRTSGEVDESHVIVEI